MDSIKWIRNNPWTIINTQSLGSYCGRFPDKDTAVKQANTYERIVEVNETTKTVYVAEFPVL